MTVSVANPDTGTVAPPTTRLIPANSPAAATAAVAAPATAAAIRLLVINGFRGAVTVVVTDIVDLR
jgi:hypothetical protein